MIEFQTVTNEFQSLISRRSALLTFLGSVFAAMGILLRNITGGKLPPALAGIESHAFALFALLLLVPSLLIALRLARLAAGITVQGVLYARLMQTQSFTTKGDTRAAARLNVLGVSFLGFFLTALIAGFSAALLALAVDHPPPRAALIGGAFVLLAIVLYLLFHRKAVAFALEKAAKEPCGAFDRNDWLEHMAESMEVANKSMITDIAFVGLMIFAGIEGMSGLGGIKAGAFDLIADEVKVHGPTAYGALMVVVGLFGLLINLRVRLAIGSFSLALDPTDRPLRPLRLTDSLLGYLLLAFLFTVAVHLLLFQFIATTPFALIGTDAGVFVLCVLAEQLTLVVAAKRVKAF
jgi:hypothetical protein